MIDIIKYIEHYAAKHGILNYALKNRVLTLKDFNTPQTFAPGIGFFYNLKVCGEIVDVNNISNPFLFVNTPSEVFNFADIATIKDYGTLQIAESDFIIVADSMLTVEAQQGASALFNKIYSAQFMYFYMTVFERKNKFQPSAENPQGVKINIIDKNY